MRVFCVLVIVSTVAILATLRSGSQTDRLHTETDSHLRERIERLEGQLRDVQLRQAAAADADRARDLDEYLACYHDPDTEQWATIGVPAVGEC